MLDKATKRAMKRGMRLQIKDPALWVLEAVEWRGRSGYASGYPQSACLFCNQLPPESKEGLTESTLGRIGLNMFGHKRGCIMSRALRKHRRVK